MMKLTVALNGTKVNPYAKMGLKQNPFPQIAKYEYTAHMLKLQSLGGEPIPDVAHIKRVLQGWSPEFVALCCRNFKPGEYVVFDVTFPESET